jgi:hypothetical protein
VISGAAISVSTWSSSASPSAGWPSEIIAEARHTRYQYTSRDLAFCFS